MSTDQSSEYWAAFEKAEVLVKFVPGKENNMSNGKGGKPGKNFFMGKKQASLKSRLREQQEIFGLKVWGQCRETLKNLAESLDLMHQDLSKMSFDKFKESNLINSLFGEDQFGSSLHHKWSKIDWLHLSYFVNNIWIQTSATEKAVHI